MRTALVRKRIEFGWTHEKAAKACGISRAYYTNIESGRKNPSYGVMKKISKAFGAGIDHLFFEQ